MEQQQTTGRSKNQDECLEVKAPPRVAAVACSSPASEDEEYSVGEFTQKDNRKRDEYLRLRAGKHIVADAKRRKKKAEREQRKLGGKIILWTIKDLKKGRTIMAMKEEAAAEEQKEKAEKKEQKEKAKAKTKKAKANGKAKGKATKKKMKNGKGRGPRIVDGTIKLLVKENPKREGSKAHKRYELYKKHKTVAKYIEAGGKRSSLRYDDKHGFIKLSGVKTTADEK